MSYSAIAMLGAVILLTVSRNAPRSRGSATSTPSRASYRRFLFAVLAFYAAGIVRGFLDGRRLADAAFADTSASFPPWPPRSCSGRAARSRTSPKKGLSSAPFSAMPAASS